MVGKYQSVWWKTSRGTKLLASTRARNRAERRGVRRKRKRRQPGAPLLRNERGRNMMFRQTDESRIQICKVCTRKAGPLPTVGRHPSRSDGHAGFVLLPLDVLTFSISCPGRGTRKSRHLFLPVNRVNCAKEDPSRLYFVAKFSQGPLCTSLPPRQTLFLISGKFRWSCAPMYQTVLRVMEEIIQRIGSFFWAF